MAAQEYYSGAPTYPNIDGTQNHTAPYPPSPPPQHQQPQQQSWANPSPASTAPPPYDAFPDQTDPFPHHEQESAPSRPPQQTPRPPQGQSPRPHRVSFADDKRPHSQPPLQTRPPPPGQLFYTPPDLRNNGYPTPPPPGYNPQHQQYPPPQPPYQQGYPQHPPTSQPSQGQYPFAPLPPQGRLYSNSNPPPPPFSAHNGRTQTPQYAAQPQLAPPPRHSKSHSPRPHSRDSSSSRSRSRSRDRRHHRRHRHHNSDDLAYGKDRGAPRGRKSDKGTVDSFLGAGLGGIIGDAIFPGLGTVGGALLGGYGGHKYGEGKDSKRDQKAARRWSDGRGHRRDDDRY